MRTCVILIFSLISICASAQEYFSETLDSLYREDQIYFGVTYNTLFNTPKAFTQTNFSPGEKAKTA